MAVGKRYSFFLFEFIIALMLLSFFISMLFHWERTLGVLQKKNERLLKWQEEQVLFQKRFHKIFQSLYFLDPQKKTFFESNEKCVHFCYDNGININPRHTGLMKATLFLNKGHLILDVKNLKGEAVRREMFYSKLTHFYFTSYEVQEELPLYIQIQFEGEIPYNASNFFIGLSHDRVAS